MIRQTCQRLRAPLLLIGLLAAGIAHAGELGVFTSGSQGFNTHTYYNDDGQEVTVFDTQFVPALTRKMVNQIRSETDSPITRVVVTHPNPDKFNGLSVFADLGATSIASKATAEAMPGVHQYKKYYFTQIAGMFEPDEYPERQEIDKTFSGQHTIELASGETITLTELDHSRVSATQTVARIDAIGALIVGDLVHHDAHAWLEGGIVDGEPQPDLQAWKGALRELRGLGGDTVYGGRGEMDVPVDAAVDQQLAYLDSVRAEVADYIDAHPGIAKDLDDAKKANKHYQALQQRLAQRFPDYELAYLVSAGIYGLLQSMVAERSE